MQVPAVWNPRASMVEHGEAHLRALAQSVGHADLEGADQVYRDMVRHWGAAPIGGKAFKSNFTLDKSPLEFSVRVGRGGAQLRWVVDCTSEGGDPLEARAVGLAVCQRLAARGADLSRFEVLRRFFWPDHPPFNPAGVGVEFAASGPLFKAYFRGARFEDANERCCAALEALGMREQAAFVGEYLRQQNVRCTIVGVDLSAGAAARVKVYFSCAGVALREAAGRLAAACGEGEDKLSLLEHFATTLAGVGPEHLERTAPRLKIAAQFVEGRAAPKDFTPYYWLFPASEGVDEDDEGELLNDEVISERLLEVFARHGLSPEPYRRALEAFARVPLRDEFLIHTYAGFQGQPGRTSVSVYLNPRFNAYSLEPEEW